MNCAFGCLFWKELQATYLDTYNVLIIWEYFFSLKKAKLWGGGSAKLIHSCQKKIEYTDKGEKIIIITHNAWR